MEQKCIKLEDGLEYAIIDEIESNDNIYVYLVNINDENDFCIRKINTLEDKDMLVGLDSNEEFDKALLLFTRAHKEETVL